MVRLIFCMFALGVLFASTASAQDAATTTAHNAATKGEAARGEKVYADQKCTVCHSIAGKGNAKGPLDEVGSKRSADEIRAWITDAKGMTTKTGAARKPPMKMFTLPKDDVDALVAYLQTLRKK